MTIWGWLIERMRQVIATVLLWIITLSLMCARKLPGQDNLPTMLIATPQVFHSLALIYREFQTEYTGCLYGFQQNDTLTIVIQMPSDLQPSRSFRWGAGPSTCILTDNFLGGVHTHPSGICKQASLMDRDRRCKPGDELEDYCQQGPADNNAFTQDSTRFSMIVCGLGELLLYDQRSPSSTIPAANNWRATVRQPIIQCHYNIDLPEPRCSPRGTGL